MRALIAIALLVPACTLYTGPDDDENIAADAGFPWWEIDARQQPDAGWNADCDASLPCPVASANRVSVCGRLRDVQTNANVSVTPALSACVPGDVNAAGACRLQIRFYDALDLAGNPSGATPFPPDSFQLDECGRFAAGNIPRPSLGFIGITVDDATGLPDDHRTTATALPVTSGQVVAREVLYAFRRATDVAWSNQAGLAGMTFADRGAIFAVYEAGGAPSAGVTITGNGSVRAADDFYFGDVNVQRSTVTPSMTSTGANGAALFLNSPLVEHSGTNPPVGCSWESQLAASVSSLLWVLPVTAETPSGTPCL